jgi:hypothetical protein
MGEQDGRRLTAPPTYYYGSRVWRFDRRTGLACPSRARTQCSASCRKTAVGKDGPRLQSWERSERRPSVKLLSAGLVTAICVFVPGAFLGLIWDSFDEIPRPPGGAGASAGTKKNRQFLDKPLWVVTVLPKSRQAELARLVGDATRLRRSNDSGMAPEAIEIAQNGLAKDDPPARGRGQGESIWRISYKVTNS